MSEVWISIELADGDADAAVAAVEFQERFASERIQSDGWAMLIGHPSDLNNMKTEKVFAWRITDFQVT